MLMVLVWVSVHCQNAEPVRLGEKNWIWHHKFKLKPIQANSLGKYPTHADSNQFPQPEENVAQPTYHPLSPSQSAECQLGILGGGG